MSRELLKCTCDIEHLSRWDGGVPLEALNSVVRDVEETEEGREEEQDVEHPRHDGDEKVGNLQDDPLGRLEAAVQGDDEHAVAEAGAQFNRKILAQRLLQFWLEIPLVH